MAEWEINPDRFLWDQLVLLIQHVWASGTLPMQLPWAILVLLLKSDGGTRGIGLLEVIWKAMSSILDGRLKAAIPFHDALHGFWMGSVERISLSSLRQSLKTTVVTLTDPHVILCRLWCPSS